MYAPTTKRNKTHNPNRHWAPHFLLLFFLHLNPFLSFIFIFIFIFQTTMPLPLPSLPDDGNHHDFVAELTHRMAAFLLSDDHTFNFSPIHSHHLDSVLFYLTTFISLILTTTTITVITTLCFFSGQVTGRHSRDCRSFLSGTITRRALLEEQLRHVREASELQFSPISRSGTDSSHWSK